MSENENGRLTNLSESDARDQSTVDRKTNPNYWTHGRSGRGLPVIRKAFWLLTFTISIGFGFYVRAEIIRFASQHFEPSYSRVARHGGTLIIAGGGHLNDAVRLRFLELAGGHEARIVVIPAVPTEDSMEELYRGLWSDYAIKSIDVIHSRSRAESDEAAFSQAIEDATGVWLSGGTQSWMADLYCGTVVEKRLKDLLARNGVIGGTSAGAAIMSEVMIASGRDRPVLSRGFGLIDTAIIDQHFVKRNRYRRLKTALLEHPNLVGFGIDEGAALQYAVATGRFDVIGSSCVVACVANMDSDHQRNLRVEFFNPGDEFDIERLRSGADVPLSATMLEAMLRGE